MFFEGTLDELQVCERHRPCADPALLRGSLGGEGEKVLGAFPKE